MGTDYALVHLYYTIPPAILLSAVYQPLSTVLGWYKVGFLLLIAVISTIPWDSYLVRNRIWTYPPEAVLGPTLFQIPMEEVFFFVIQTYNTSILYLLLNKPTFFPTYLRAGKGSSTVKDCFKIHRLIGQCFLAFLVAFGGYQVLRGGRGTYLGLILIWAMPFLFLLWTLAYQLIVGLPWTSTILPITIPTLYLWIVDTMALRRGTWVIESGTKLDAHLWVGLEIEEAIFFLITNILVVFGLIAFDNSIAIIEAFPDIFPSVPTLPSPLLLVKTLLLPTSSYDSYRILGFQQALERLRLKSRSFYLASGVFYGRTRIDLTLLYAFCRVADDLVDNAASPIEVENWIKNLNQYLDLKYSSQPNQTKLSTFISTTFPPRTHAILILLPTSHLPSQPLYGLIRGFVTDLNFSKSDNPFPIATERHLFDYASYVAGTVGELVLSTIYYYTPSSPSRPIDPVTRTRCISAGFRMGVALQYVNIARDIATDAAEGRVYLPTTWLSESLPPLTPEAIISSRGAALRVPALRKRLLDRAFDLYYENRDTIEELPAQARGPVRVAVEGYMEIGRVILDGKYAEDKRRGGRATVPKMRRLWVGWKALNGVRGGSGRIADGAS